MLVLPKADDLFPLFIKGDVFFAQAKKESKRKDRDAVKHLGHL
jgi:hypothetical protein